MAAVALYRFEIDQGNSERTEFSSLDHEPSEGEALPIAGMTVVVTRFTPVPEADQEFAGHAGVVACRLDR